MFHFFAWWLSETTALKHKDKHILSAAEIIPWVLVSGNIRFGLCGYSRGFPEDVVSTTVGSRKR